MIWDMDREIAVWCAFCGLIYILMGLNLILGAASHARLVKEWTSGEDLAEGGMSPGLVWAYRAGGGIFIVLGLLLEGMAAAPERLAWLAPAVSEVPQVPAGRISLWPASRLRPSPTARLTAGLFFFCCGFLWTGFKAAAWWRRRLTSPLEEKLGLEPQAPGWRERAGQVVSWLMAATFFLFGVYLLERAMGS